MANRMIAFNETTEPFHPRQRPENERWIDTSFTGDQDAVGELRLLGVGNGHYESKHPIVTPTGITAGLLVNGRDTIGYTYACVYAGRCFWVAHQTLSASLEHGISFVSLVGESGGFLFRKERKFKVVKTFNFGNSWVDTIKAFKLLDNGDRLFYLTKHGGCLFDTRALDIVAKFELDDLDHRFSGFDLSPKVKLLALGACTEGAKDPVDGERRYKNLVRLYNLETGDIIGEQSLPSDQHEVWRVEFSENGRQLRLTSKSSAHVLELTTSP